MLTTLQSHIFNTDEQKGIPVVLAGRRHWMKSEGQ